MPERVLSRRWTRFWSNIQALSSTSATREGRMPERGRGQSATKCRTASSQPIGRSDHLPGLRETR